MKDVGAPSTFKPEYCDELVAHMSQGFSYESFAATIKKSRSTLYLWEKEHPEWKEAKERAFDACLLYWEQEGIKGLWAHSGGGNMGPIHMNLQPALYIFNMKARFGWKDRSPEEADKVIVNNNTVQTLTPDQFSNLVEAARGKK